MVRPTNANSASTLEAIRTSALELLREAGIDALTFRRVADRSGVSVGTVRYYFPTSEALFESCLDIYQTGLFTLEDSLVEAFLAADDLADAIHHAIGVVFEYLEREKPLLRLRLVMSAKQGGLSAARKAGTRDPFMRNVVKALVHRTQRTPLEMRLRVDTLMRVVSGYAACSEAEMCSITAEPSPPEARKRLAAYCADLAVELILGAHVEAKDPISPA